MCLPVLVLLPKRYQKRCRSICNGNGPWLIEIESWWEWFHGLIFNHFAYLTVTFISLTTTTTYRYWKIFLSIQLDWSRDVRNIFFELGYCSLLFFVPMENAIELEALTNCVGLVFIYMKNEKCWTHETVVKTHKCQYMHVLHIMHMAYHLSFYWLCTMHLYQRDSGYLITENCRETKCIKPAWTESHRHKCLKSFFGFVGVVSGWMQIFTFCCWFGTTYPLDLMQQAITAVQRNAYYVRNILHK